MKFKKDSKKFNTFINIWIITFIILFIICMIYIAFNSNNETSIPKEDINTKETVRFKLKGNKKVTVYVGSTFKDPGYEAESNIDGDISEYVKIEGKVDTEKPNTYKIVYTLNYKGVSPKRIRTVIVKEKNDTDTNVENDELVLSMNGSNNLSILKGAKYEEPGVKAITKKGKDISKNIKTYGEVNTDVVGTYKINYFIVDSKNRTLELTRLVTVSDIAVTITPSTKSYTKENITLSISVNDNKYSHMKLPNGQIVKANTYTYKVGKNGKYTFDIYNTDDLVKEYTYEVKNIDREKPNGICEVVQTSTETYIKVNAKDNIGVKGYVYNDKTYTTDKINVSEVLNPTKVTLYDEANNATQITCKNNGPIISKLSKDGVIITVESKKSGANISGYYFSYNNNRPDKNTGGYLATSNEKIDLVRLPGTTYVWVEDKNGIISAPKTITIDNSALLLTRDSKYKKLEKTSLETYLKNKGWSLTELNNLIIRSSRAAGLYSQEAAATSAVALQTVLAQKYNLKLPYWWGGKSWDIGADKSWGIYKEKYSEEYDVNYYYYGLDCSGFTTWAYVNAGYNIKRGQYPSYWGNTTKLTKDNGEIGDFLVEKGHVTIIVGKTKEGYIKAEAAGKGPGMVLTLHPYTKTSGYFITKGSLISSKYPKMDRSSFPSGF
ncbi:MAG: DUF5011 domain-containing protein [Bacilli bacterium]|nr:DUF5011 domain-containing protein [Bacilli bacterium]